jgi:hypothetical protein
MDTAFLIERIAKTKATIILYEDAIDALVVGGVEEYTLDTSQSRQTVRKFDIDKLQSVLDSLYNRLCTMQARLSGGGTVTVRPCW